MFGSPKLHPLRVLLQNCYRLCVSNKFSHFSGKTTFMTWLPCELLSHPRNCAHSAPATLLVRKTNACRAHKLQPGILYPTSV